MFPRMPCVSFGGCFYNRLRWWVWGIQLCSAVDCQSLLMAYSCPKNGRRYIFRFLSKLAEYTGITSIPKHMLTGWMHCELAEELQRGPVSGGEFDFQKP